MYNQSKKIMMNIHDASLKELSSIKYVLMDIDDTLTKQGKLLRESYNALWDLHEGGFVVIPVTGRPAGWCDMIAREWPCDAVIGENGAFAFWEDKNSLMTHFYHYNAVKVNSNLVIEKAKNACLLEVPGCRVSKDQFSRLFDLAIDFAEEEPILGLDKAEKIKAICEREGLIAKISSIHVNAWLGDYTKVTMAEHLLSNRFFLKDDDMLAQVFFIGDSPNDEPMFSRFFHTCAVANVKKYSHLININPRYITTSEYGTGFAEAAKILCNAKNNI